MRAEHQLRLLEGNALASAAGPRLESFVFQHTAGVLAMLRVLGSPARFCDGITRRDALTVGASTLLGAGFTLPNLLASEERRSTAGQRPGSAKSVIVVYLHGGAPTQDMWDLKPAAPPEIRGEFKPISTSVPGVQICEHLPQTAKWVHKLAIVRSVNHRAGCHNTLPSFTGSEQPVDVNEPIPKDGYPPGMGAVCEYLKPAGVDLPHYVALPTVLGWGFNLDRPGPHGGFLGKRCDPLWSLADPKIDPKPPAGRRPMWFGTPRLADATLAPDMTIDRLDTRRTLLEQLDAEQRRVEATANPSQYDRTRRRAFGLLTASKLKDAFDLSKESPRTRDRYGHHLFGNSALVARRLIEAGVRFVDLYWDGYSYRFPTGLDPYWDTHSKNFEQLKQVNLPYLDRTYAALISDLHDRGLLDETLVVVMSDMGRTPRVNGAAGRDHWTFCYSVVFAGAGVRGGTVCGASDAQAAYVKDRPVRPADICATVYQQLGIDPDMPVHDRANRPVAVGQGGEAIREIVG